MTTFIKRLSKRHASHLFITALVVYDIICLAASNIILDIFHPSFSSSTINSKALYHLTTTTLWILSLGLAGIYNNEKSFLDIEHSKRTLKGLCFGFAIVFFMISFYPADIDQYCIILRSILSSLLIFYGHIYLHHHLKILKILSGKRILIYGAGSMGHAIFNCMASSRHSLIPVGFIDDDTSKLRKIHTSSGLFEKSSIEVLGSIEELDAIARMQKAEQLIVAISSISKSKLHAVEAACKRIKIEMAFIPNLHGYPLHEIHPTILSDIPIVLFSAKHNWIYPIAKRLFDIIVGGAILIALTPLLAIIAIAIFLQDFKSPFFVHARTGLNGIPFRMVKFRSMHCSSNPYEITPQCHDDIRITNIGKFLRKFSLDELPQLYNVIKGEMSLVGPRPEMPFITDQYTTTQRQRLRVTPGITGLWQISVDRNHAIHENIEYDLYYIRNRSFFLDLTILLETIAFFFRGI